MARSFFFLGGFARDKNGHYGWPDLSPPGSWGGSRPPLVARSISFFGPKKLSERAVGGNVCSPEVGGGGWRRLGS
jgi:hypothetical protein